MTLLPCLHPGTSVRLDPLTQLTLLCPAAPLRPSDALLRTLRPQIGFLGPAFFLTQLGNVHTVTGAVLCMMAAQVGGPGRLAAAARRQRGCYSRFLDALIAGSTVRRAVLRQPFMHPWSCSWSCILLAH